jgi:hypothetical protein
MKKKWIIAVVAVLMISYVGSYAILGALGGYRFDQSGMVRYEIGPAASDLEMWHPKYAWYQDHFETIDGKRTTRGNALGYFYSPLIKLDRMLIHKTRVIEEVRKAAAKK